MFQAARESLMKNEAEVVAGLSPTGTPRRRPNSRTGSNAEQEDLSDSIRGK